MEYNILVVNGESYKRLGEKANTQGVFFNVSVPKHVTIELVSDMIMEVDVKYFDSVIMDIYTQDNKTSAIHKVSCTGAVPIPDELIQMSLKYGDEFNDTEFDTMIEKLINDLLVKSRH